MADAVAAFKEAFSSYKSNVADYAVYSIFMNITSMVLALAFFAAMLVLGALTFGGISSILASGSGFSLNLVGIGTTVIILVLGLLVFLWVQSGLNGAYLETLNMLLTGRKQSFEGFMKAVPKRATTLLVVSILVGICVMIPIALFAILGWVVGGGQSLVSLALILIGMLVAGVLLLLFIFALPAAVVDNKGAVQAVRTSASLASHNIAAVVVYIVLSAIVAIPMVIPGVGILYSALFYLPIVQSALIVLYKKAK